MDMKETADVSRFMLFEVTGDSEADCDDAIMDEAVGYEIAKADDDDDDGDDDAQSCSYDGSENQNCNVSDQQLDGHESCVSDVEYEHHDGKKNEKGEAGAAFGTSYCDDDEIQKHHHKSSLSVDSGQQLMDEMEKNRRFWEACLAS